MKTIANVSVDFVITVQVTVDADLLPNDIKTGDSYHAADLPDEAVQDILKSVEYYTGQHRKESEMEIVTIGEIEEIEDEEENEEDMYNNSPEYVHDAALDWFFDHSGDYYEDELEDGEPIMDCEDALREEGYDIDDPDCREAVHEAYNDFMDER
jgi:hypothetical protein